METAEQRIEFLERQIEYLTDRLLVAEVHVQKLVSKVENKDLDFVQFTFETQLENAQMTRQREKEIESLISEPFEIR